MAEPIHLELLADFFNRIGPKRRGCLTAANVRFPEKRTWERLLQISWS